MTYLILILLAISIFFNIYFLRSRSKKKNDIIYMEKKLQKITSDKTDEKLMLYTSDKQIQSLLIQINSLLEHNQKTVADFHGVERSMRKMLSNVSHDLKTPLTVILGYIEIILNDKTISPVKMNSLLQTINLKTVEVLDLISRFFELVKIESEDSNYENSKIDLNEVCRKVILEYYEILTTKKFEVSVEIPEESTYVWGNIEAIERILNNLISNSINYGAEGKMIGLKLTSLDDCAYIEVSDKGKGISEHDKDRIFERLYTMEDSRNKLYQGSGIGLTITKRLVEQMNGTISVKSIPFQQTTFTIQLKRLSF
ncbi:sensor histidine kinase [Psychrobacillus psychrotolerans]|uniref:sensor histidine kinase n=1 Tax=Psychrobacillus psychrotolerans TaxID=126156 RepID=UPI003B012F49